MTIDYIHMCEKNLALRTYDMYVLPYTSSTCHLSAVACYLEDFDRRQMKHLGRGLVST